MDELNYRYRYEYHYKNKNENKNENENSMDSDVAKLPDIIFTKCFIGKPRDKEATERFQAYGSMSPAREEIEAMLKYMLTEQKEETIQKVA